MNVVGVCQVCNVWPIFCCHLLQLCKGISDAKKVIGPASVSHLAGGLFLSVQIGLHINALGMEVHPGLLFFRLQPTGWTLILELASLCNEAV